MGDFDHSKCRFIVGQRVKITRGCGFLHGYYDLSGAGTVEGVIATPGGFVYNVRLDEPRSNGLLMTNIVQLVGDEIEAA